LPEYCLQKFNSSRSFHKWRGLIENRDTFGNFDASRRGLDNLEPLIELNFRNKARGLTPIDAAE